jgi:hypothetical protein
MLFRPEGLLPSRTRRAELHSEEDEEDQYDEKDAQTTPRPVVTT